MEVIEIAWKPFVPVFFLENDEAPMNDLTLMPTFGWKPTVSLEEIGNIHIGHRFMVASKEPVKECVDRLFKQRNESGEVLNADTKMRP